MEKERKIKSMSLVAMIVAVLGLTVAFAALSQTLTINGTAKVEKATWDIHYAAADGASANKTKSTHSANVTVTEGDVSGTTVSGLSATLTKPGDTVTFYWDVVNNGDIDAYISSLVPATIDNTQLQCTATNNQDATNVCNDLVFTFKYVDGDAVKTNDTLAAKTGNNATVRHLELTLTYPSTVTSEGAGATWPTGDVNITLPTITTTYSQSLE